MINFTRFILTLLLLSSLALAGCQKVTQGPEPLPEISIGVAQFTQPTQTWDLLAGYIPETQQTVEYATLADLDNRFESILFNTTNRRYSAQGASTRCLELQKQEKQSTALAKWIEVGRCMKVEMLIVPQLIDWHTRSGGEMGSFSPASVKMDIFVIDVKKERPLSRFHFDETQESLDTNLLGFSKFLERKGKWVSAPQLAEEGMRQAVKELGL